MAHYYAHSIQAIRELLSKSYGIGTACKDVSARPTHGHLLWMCLQIESLDPENIKDATKAARWIGWIFAVLELNATLEWDNKLSHKYARLDVREGRDLPALHR